MKRVLLLALLLLSLAVAGRLAACPACAGSSTAANGKTQEKSVWPIVGVFLLVPPLLGGVVIAALRRESRR